MNADIIAIGSGHNGLVAAAYCAVAGKKVLVLERNPWFGGGVVNGRGRGGFGSHGLALARVSVRSVMLWTEGPGVFAEPLAESQERYVGPHKSWQFSRNAWLQS